MVCLARRDPVDIAGPPRLSDVGARPLNFTVRAHARDSWQEEDSILSKGRLGEGFVWRQRNVRAPGAAGDFALGLSARRNGFDASSAGLPA